VITLNGFIAWQKTIDLHVEFFIAYLHDERCTKIDQVSVSNIGKQRIRKTFRVLLQQLIKLCLPKKINKALQLFGRLNPVVIIFKMIDMKEFDVLQWLTLYAKDNLTVLYKKIFYISGIYFLTILHSKPSIRNFAP
jgi:hypothetical protein